MEVILSNKAIKFLDSLDIKTRNELTDILRLLEENPIPYKFYDIKKIKGAKNFFRIRKGKIRIIYSIESKQDRIFVDKIEWRESAYD